MDTLKVFISSPGDVEFERTLAAQVINLLQVEFNNRVNLIPVLWEQEALLVTSTFQDQVVLPSQCDIAVFILGDRFGTPLPAQYQREDGSRYRSGTEFEFEDAMVGYRENGKPQILAYRKSRDKYIKINDSRLDEILDQKRELEKFIGKWFLNDDKTFSGALHTFRSSDEFEQMIETHLYKLISQMVNTGSQNELDPSKRWVRGNPYLGLNSFRYEHSQIYFGRTRAISECIDLLHHGDDSGCPFLLMLGMSGGGKSSLAHAGIVPMLVRQGIDRGIKVNRWASIRPGDQRDELVQQLAAVVINQLTVLKDADKRNLLECARTANDEELASLLISVLKGEQENEHERFILVIDQFEELFTSSLITRGEQSRLIELLNTLVRESPIWCISTLRSDFYPEFTNSALLIALKNDGAQYDLSPPSTPELSLMIRGPAIAAGLHFEKDHETGEHLDQKVLNAAANNPEILPLLEYTLSELYENRSEEGWLTFEAYEKLGGVEGALAKTAERCFSSLSALEQQELPRVFNTLVEFSEDGSSGRCWAKVEEFDNSQLRAFLAAFVEARLFVIELDDQQHQIVTVSHESLFRHWPRLRDWVEENKDQLRVRSRVNATSGLWAESGQSNDLLLGRGKPAEEARLLLSSGLSLSDTTMGFIAASLARVQLNRQLRYGGFALVFFFAIGAAIAAYDANLSNQDSLRRLVQNDDLVTFMLDDLIAELKPIGVLEPIRIVGEKAIEYFETIDDEDRTDTARIKHAQALHQLGEIYLDRGEFAQATTAFTESLRQAEVLHKLDPANSEREYELGQAYYWVAFSNMNYKRLVEAKKYFELYLRVSISLALKDSSNVDWQMELGFAYGSNGALEESRHNYSEALEYFNSATNIFASLKETYPDRQDIARELAGNYSWMGSMYRYLGYLQKSLDYFSLEESITQRLINENNDADWRYSMVHVHRHLGELYIDMGNLENARNHFNLGLNIVDELVAGDAENTRWLYGQTLCNLYLTQIGIYLGNYQDAQEFMDNSMVAISQLMSRGDPITDWRILEVRSLLLSATLNYETGRDSIANFHSAQANDSVMALLAENPENLDVRRLALQAGLALAIQNDNESSRMKNLELTSGLITNELVSSDRPDDLIAMLKFYRYKGDEIDNMISYSKKLEGLDIRHPEISRILIPGVD